MPTEYEYKQALMFKEMHKVTISTMQKLLDAMTSKYGSHHVAAKDYDIAVSQIEEAIKEMNFDELNRANVIIESYEGKEEREHHAAEILSIRG